MTMETKEILNDNELMKSIQRSEEDLKENKLLTFREILRELGIDEKEL